MRLFLVIFKHCDDGLVVGSSGHQLHMLYKFPPIFGPLSNLLSKAHTVFENHRESLIQHCELRLRGQKFIKSVKKS